MMAIQAETRLVFNLFNDNQFVMKVVGAIFVYQPLR
jgi:hypothetical protein